MEAAAAGGALRNEARKHVEGCTTCSAALAEEQTLFDAIDAGLRHNSDAELSPSFLARVRAAAETEPVSGRKHEFALSWALVGAAALVVLGISLAQSFRGEKQLPIESTTARVAVVPAMRGEAPREGDTPKKNHNFMKKSYRAGMDRSANSRLQTASIARTGTPEVLVPAGQRDLLVRYLEGLNAANSVSTITPSLAHQVNVTNGEIPPIEISELVIRPLAGPGTD
jgi:negative regulator of sigma E activity